MFGHMLRPQDQQKTATYWANENQLPVEITKSDILSAQPRQFKPWFEGEMSSSQNIVIPTPSIGLKPPEERQKQKPGRQEAEVDPSKQVSESQAPAIQSESQNQSSVVEK